MNTKMPQTSVLFINTHSSSYLGLCTHRFNYPWIKCIWWGGGLCLYQVCTDFVFPTVSLSVMQRHVQSVHTVLIFRSTEAAVRKYMEGCTQTAREDYAMVYKGLTVADSDVHVGSGLTAHSLRTSVTTAMVLTLMREGNINSHECKLYFFKDDLLHNCSFCIHVCVLCVQCPQRSEEAIRGPGATDSCCCPVGAGTRTLVLCKSSKCLELLSHFSCP